MVPVRGQIRWRKYPVEEVEIKKEGTPGETPWKILTKHLKIRVKATKFFRDIELNVMYIVKIVLDRKEIDI